MRGVLDRSLPVGSIVARLLGSSLARSSHHRSLFIALLFISFALMAFCSSAFCSSRSAHRKLLPRALLRPRLSLCYLAVRSGWRMLCVRRLDCTARIVRCLSTFNYVYRNTE